MKRGIVAVLALLAAGCGGNSYVQFSSSGSPQAGISSGGTVYAQGSSALGTLLAIGIFAGASYASDRDYESYAMPRPSSSFMPTQRGHALPELDPARSVNEQDCSKPIENRSANLRCR